MLSSTYKYIFLRAISRVIATTRILTLLSPFFHSVFLLQMYKKFSPEKGFVAFEMLQHPFFNIYIYATERSSLFILLLFQPMSFWFL